MRENTTWNVGGFEGKGTTPSLGQASAPNASTGDREADQDFWSLGEHGALSLSPPWKTLICLATGKTELSFPIGGPNCFWLCSVASGAERSRGFTLLHTWNLALVRGRQQTVSSGLVLGDGSFFKED